MCIFMCLTELAIYTDVLTEEQHEIVETAAEVLYGLIHARYILTTAGMNRMVRQFFRLHFVQLTSLILTTTLSQKKLSTRSFRTWTSAGALGVSARASRCCRWASAMRRESSPWRCSVRAATRPTTPALPSTPTWTGPTSAPPSATSSC